MKTSKYNVDIRWSEEDQAYIARVPELDGVVTHGDSFSEAAKMAEEAIELHLESLQAHNEKIPTPVALAKVSGKYPLRMSKETHQDLLIEAKKENISLNEFVNNVIESEIRWRRVSTGTEFTVRPVSASVQRKKQSPEPMRKGSFSVSKKRSAKSTTKRSS